MQNGRCDHHGVVEETLAPSIESLRNEIEKSGGNFHYWGGNNYMDFEFPHPGSAREDFPDVHQLPWEKQYRELLKRATWQSLRNMAFRFSRLATSIASRCVDFGIKNVLIPSVGLCVDPWLVANHGLAVTATETARSALEALSDPAHWPRVYSRAAYERWDIATCAAFACIPHPDYFAEMPLLEDAAVRDRLRSRINFLHNDWASIPLESGSVDVVFAANAVPRESAEERTKVLEEWIRVLRPGGVIFISQHHVPMDWNIEQFFNERNLVATDFLGGNCPARNVRAGFQLRYTSG